MSKEYDEFVTDLTQRATQYFTNDDELTGQVPSRLLVDFVIEKYVQHRNYPTHYDDKKILSDMEKHKSTIAMAVVDIFVKVGAEGEKSHTESGVSRVYENAYVSSSVFNDVLPFVRTL